MNIFRYMPYLFSYLTFIMLVPNAMSAMECGRSCESRSVVCDSRGNCSPTDARCDGNRICFNDSNGRATDCYCCTNTCAQNGDRHNTSGHPDNQCHLPSGIICSVDDTGKRTYYNQNGEKVLIMEDCSICTQGEILLSTAIYGEWAQQTEDPVLEGMQATIIGIIKILRMFDSGRFWTGINSSGFFSKLRAECSMEYLDQSCRLPHVEHPCFKNWDPSKKNPETNEIIPPLSYRAPVPANLKTAEYEAQRAALLGYRRS